MICRRGVGIAITTLASSIFRALEEVFDCCISVSDVTIQGSLVTKPKAGTRMEPGSELWPRTPSKFLYYFLPHIRHLSQRNVPTYTTSSMPSHPETQASPAARYIAP